MSRTATKKAVKQLQKLLDRLGEFGGKIETNNPDVWWPLALEVERIKEDGKDISIGVFSVWDGDVLYDPIFHLTLKMDQDRIVEAWIHSREDMTILGSTFLDGEDMMHGFGMTEKDSYGLRKRFSDFMNNMTETGPYLREPKSITRFERDL